MKLIISRPKWFKKQHGYEIDNAEAGIKWWELLILVIGGYLKEILECLVATFSNSKYTLGNILQSHYIWLDNTFWNLTLKVYMVIILMTYFLIRLKNKNPINLWYVIVFLVFATATDIFSIFQVPELTSFVNFPIIVVFMMWFFFAKDQCNNLDALKKALYDDGQLYVNKFNNRLYKYPGAKKSFKKIEKIVIVVCGTITAILFMTFVITKIIEWYNKSNGGAATGGGGGSSSTPNETPKNQAIINKYLETTPMLLMFFNVSIKAPIVEELVFRKCVMDLGKNRFWTSILSGTMFGIMHLHDESLSKGWGYIMPGIFMSIGKYFTRNVWFGIFTHATYNTIILFSLYWSHLKG